MIEEALLFLRPFWPLIWRALAIAAVTAFGWWAWDHYIADPYIAQGAAQEHVKTLAAEAANKSLAAERDAARKELEEAQQSYHAENERISKEKARVNAENAATIRLLLDNTKRLAAIANGPKAPTKKEACDEADALLDEYVAGRVRD